MSSNLQNNASFYSAVLLRRAIVGCTLAIGAIAMLPSITIAQDSAPAGIDNSKFQAMGAVNANAVFVRSGPSENDYGVMKLDKGAELTVVGKRSDWLKVLPPSGTFCYVAKAYVEKHGDGTRGSVTNTLYVRVGSTLNELKTKIAMKLEPGEEVKIIGEQDEYFKIAPPDGVFLYVKSDYVTATKVLAENKPAEAQPGQPTTPGEDSSKLVKQPEQPSEPAVAEGKVITPLRPIHLAGGGESAGSPSTQPTEVAINNDLTGPTTSPATQPTAEARFTELEAAYATMMQKPLDEQEIPTVRSGYAALASAGPSELPETLRRIAEAKAKLLANREKDRDDFITVKKRQTEMAEKQKALAAETEELQDRIAKSDVKYYAAVGVLRPSSLQQGQGMLFRLTDPSTGRTVVYIRSTDTKIGNNLGQFIGVKGSITNDEQLGLRTITPTSFEPCDSSKLFTRIAAEIVPPSLMPGGGAQAATTNQ